MWIVPRARGLNRPLRRTSEHERFVDELEETLIEIEILGDQQPTTVALALRERERESSSEFRSCFGPWTSVDSMTSATADLDSAFPLSEKLFFFRETFDHEERKNWAYT